MGFASESGYVPLSIETIMSSIKDGVNAQRGTAYTDESFLGTNYYKFYYAMVQRLQENEVKTSEIFSYLQQYFNVTNERIQRPVATNPGLIEAFSNASWIASVKKMIDADAGKINICVDAIDDHARGYFTITSYANLVSGTHDSVTVGATVFTAQGTSVTPGGTTFQAATSNAATATSLAAQINAHATAGALVYAWVDATNSAKVLLRAIARGTTGNSIALAYTDHDSNVGATKSATTLLSGITRTADYDDQRLAICTIIKDSVAGGIVSQGNEVESITLTNGQSFDFKFKLPNRIPVGVRLTTTLSENNQVVIGDPEDTKTLLLANIAAKYALGKDFEPQRYFTTADAPWTAAVLLEWTSDVSNGVDIDVSPTWHSTINEAAFDDLFEFSIGRTLLVEE